MSTHKEQIVEATKAARASLRAFFKASDNLADALHLNEDWVLSKALPLKREPRSTRQLDLMVESEMESSIALHEKIEARNKAIAARNQLIVELGITNEQLKILAL
jgi:hypothetical protein